MTSNIGRRKDRIAAFVCCALAALQFVVPGPAAAQEGTDLTARMSLYVSGPHHFGEAAGWHAFVLIQNVSKSPVHGPLSAVVTGIDAPGMTVANASWHASDGAPLLDVPLLGGTLRPGHYTYLHLRFAGPPHPRFTFALALFAFPNPRPALPASGVAILTNAAGIVPGEPVEAFWRLNGGQPSDDRSLQIRAVSPGVGRSPAGGQWSNPGNAPPTGAVSYLNPLGTWQPEPVVYQPRARNGRAAFALPADTEGAWQIEVILADGRGAVIDRAASALLVSQGPALYLRLNRPIAGTLDVVQAMLITGAGASPRPARLLTWLVDPDGTQLGLPMLVPNALELRDGVLQTDRLTLWDRSAGRGAAGAYQVHARLFDAQTGELLARASAGFEVCDASRTLKGTLWSAGGPPLGANAMLATIQALDLDDLAIAAATAPRANGEYALTLPPGRYGVQATVIDAAGVHRADSLVEIGCGGGAVSLDLTAVPPTPGANAARRP